MTFERSFGSLKPERAFVHVLDGPQPADALATSGSAVVSHPGRSVDDETQASRTKDEAQRQERALTSAKSDERPPDKDEPMQATTSSTPTRATYLRRRVVAVAVLVLLAFLLTVAIGRVTAEADLEDAVAGHVVVRPGETLWDVAVATVPEGMDPRQQLDDLRHLNNLTGAVDAWTPVLLPAR